MLPAPRRQFSELQFTPRQIYARMQGAWLEPPTGVRLGPNLAVNGDFSNGTTGWINFGSNNWSVSNGAATHTPGAYGAVNQAYATLPIVAGKRYAISVDITRSASSVYLYCGGITLTPSPIALSGSYAFDIVANGGGGVNGAFIIEASNGFDGTVDNISIREVFTAATPGIAWQENTGVTPVSAPTQTVGLLLDQSQGMLLGPELVTNGVFDTDSDWTKAAAWSISGGSANVSGADGSSLIQGGKVIGGNFYRMTYTILNYTSGGLRLISGSSNYTGPTHSSNGNYVVTIYVASTGSGNISFSTVGTTALSLDNVSVKQVLGNHAYQATAANRPTFQLDSNSLPLIRHDTTDVLTASLPAINVRRNLLTYSEQFDNAAWLKVNGSITSTGHLDPYGKNSASVYVENATTGQHGIYQRWSDSGAAGVYAGQLCVKQAGKRFISLRIDTGNTPYACIDLQNGIVVSGSGVRVTALIDNWFLLETTKTLNSGNQYITLDFLQTSSFSSFSYTGDGVSGVYICRPQFEFNQISTDYQKITDWTSEAYSSSGSVYFATPQGMSCLHNQSMGTTYNLPALSTDVYAWCVTPARLNAVQESQLDRYMRGKVGLVEQDYLWEVFRRNLVTYSEQFDVQSSGVGWIRGMFNAHVKPTVVPNTNLDINGYQTADTLVSTHVSASSIGANLSLPVSPGERYTFSVYLQAGTFNWATVNLVGGTDNTYVTLIASTVCSLSSSLTRYTVTGTIPASGVTQLQCAIQISGGGNNSQIGDTIVAWGGQLESGSVATPYQRIDGGPDPYVVIPDVLLMDDGSEVILRG